MYNTNNIINNILGAKPKVDKRSKNLENNRESYKLKVNFKLQDVGFHVPLEEAKQLALQNYGNKFKGALLELEDDAGNTYLVRHLNK